MSAARTKFLGRLDSFRHASEKPDLRNSSLANNLENEASRYLRNGLQIMIFCSVEDFLRERIVELLAQPRFAGVRFQNLPSELQRILMLDSTEAMINNLKYEQSISGDTISSFVREIVIISQSASENMPYSKFAFGRNKSNISFDDIDNILKAFNVSSPATGISSISMRAGFTIAGGPKNNFTNLAKKRHSAAHDSQCAIELTDLDESIKFGLAFGMSFDILATVAVINLSSSQTIQTEGNRIKLRAVCERPDGKWGEHRLEGATRKKAAHVHLTEELATIAAQARLVSSEGLIIQGRSGLPIRWFI